MLKTSIFLAVLAICSGFAPRALRFRGVTTERFANVANLPETEEAIGFKVNPRRFIKSTKQLATLGPASNSFEMIEKLFLSGADIFRLNFSHGEHSEKAKLVDMIRAVEKKHNHPIAILGDLQGPKLRVGTFEGDSVMLTDGQTFRFDLNDDLGDEYRVKLPHTEILNTLQVDDFLLLDDGKLKMKVTETTMASAAEGQGSVTCEVINGGKLSNKKGVNTPSIVLPISPLTAKDRLDLEFMLTLSIDWIALSFVQTPADMKEFRSLAGNKAKLMAKLEKPSAVKYHLDEIIALSDGIMVARGDLGVEMSPWEVPVVQKQIVDKCKKLGKPVVIATQMMESMIESPTPTRAEASDCATAIFDSSDAVMLSAESAAGRFPVESVTMQQMIINAVEPDPQYQAGLEQYAWTLRDSSVAADITSSAITMAVRQVALTSKSKAIVVFTASGGTVLNIAKIRPNCPIIAACENVEIARQLAMVWGVYPVVIESPAIPFNIRVELDKVCKLVCTAGYADPKTDLLTFTAGLPWGTPGTTNLIRVTSAAGPDYWLDPDDTSQVKKYVDSGYGSDCEF